MTYALLLLAGGVLAYAIMRLVGVVELHSARERARELLEDARREVEAKRREALLEAKEEALRVKNELEREIRERRNETLRMERRLLQKEESLDRKVEQLEKKEENLSRKEAECDRLKAELQELQTKQRRELERISGLSSEEARKILLAEVEREMSGEIAQRIKEMEMRAKEESDRREREIISLAIQRCAGDHVAEATVSVVALPNDEMKGRIIGREGRNIRALETLTGIDLIIDDTPEAVILSGFDPVRREVARVALE
ncbi:MAG: Rnase Y domain-containing protein, partial [Firmicutes bacterium]|nr:Rnase Y domain-containing protein [Bacillota bacterium]